jgi:hypothetical protein
MHRDNVVTGCGRVGECRNAAGREGRLMVKIRYAELPAGLHVATEGHDGYTIVYLLPGLTPAQRRAALTFARRSARIGHGPSLPAIDMAFALAADRARTAGRTFVAALRRHPMLLLPLVVVVSGVIVAIMFSVVTVTLAPARVPTTTPTKLSGHRPVAQSAATDRGVSAASVRSDTAAGGAARLPVAGRLCFTVGRDTICVRS